MTHQLLWNVLDAQRTNATLSSAVLRGAAANLIGAYRAGAGSTRIVLMAFDAAGERIIGAAMALEDDVAVFDYTNAFPAGVTCLLVGGHVAGPVGVADAAAAVTAAGARRVEVALIGGWTKPIVGVARVRDLGDSRANVA